MRTVPRFFLLSFSAHTFRMAFRLRTSPNVLSRSKLSQLMCNSVELKLLLPRAKITFEAEGEVCYFADFFNLSLGSILEC